MKKIKLLIFIFFFYTACTGKVTGTPDFSTKMDPECYYVNNSLLYASSRYHSSRFNGIAIPIYGGTKEPVYEDDIIKHKNSLKMGTLPVMPLLSLCFQDRGRLDVEVKNILRFYNEKGFIHAAKPDFFVWESGGWVLYYNIIKPGITGYFMFVIVPSSSPKEISQHIKPNTNPFNIEYVKKGDINLSVELGEKIPGHLRWK